jgi:hypothetical protein
VSRPKVYLAGAMELVDEAHSMEWRADASAYIHDMTSCESVDPYHYEVDESDSSVVNIDKGLIAKCSALLVDGRVPGWGTAMEVYFAWDRNIPIVVWGIDREDAPKWLRYHSTLVVKELPAAVMEVAALI